VADTGPCQTQSTFSFSTLAATLLLRMEVKKLLESKNQQEVVAVSQTDLHKLFTAYLVVTKNSEPKMNEYNHQLTAFNSSINAVEAKLKLWQTLVHVKHTGLYLHSMNY